MRIPIAAGALLVTASLLIGGSASAAGPTVTDITLPLSNTTLYPTGSTTGILDPGWTNLNKPSRDAAITGGALRISNKSLFTFGSQLSTPALGQTAGEDGKGDVNTFDATFTVASATGAAQNGLNVEVAFDNGGMGRQGGLVSLLHKDGALLIGTFHIDPTVPLGTPNTEFEWQEHTIASVAADAAHTVRTVIRFEDGTLNDVVDVYVDGALAYTGPTWEHLFWVKSEAGSQVDRLSFSAGKSINTDPATHGAPTFGNVPAAPATNGAGILFSDISYRSYERVVPAEPTLPTTPSTPTPDTDLGAPASGAPEQTITVTGEGFDAYETVQLTWFSTPVFGGWVQADAWGRVSATVTVPASLPVGAHTLQAQGVRSGRVATTAFTVVLPHTGAPADGTLALSLGGVLLLAGGAIVGARALRRGRAAA